MISEYIVNTRERYHFVAKKQLGNTPIIWQYWGQGYEDVPELVSICLHSVEKFKGNCELIRLSDENLSEYIELPDFVLAKKDIFPKAIFSDLVRCVLLVTYGGAWLDATVLLTGKLPERYFDLDFFMFQRDNLEKNQKYWKSVYAPYFGWSKGFKVRVLNSVIFAKKHSEMMLDIAQLLLVYWRNETKLHHYFFFQILFEQIISRWPDKNCPIESDCTPHILQQIVNTGYQGISFEQVIQMSNIHKLSYKEPGAVVRLKSMLNRS